MKKKNFRQKKIRLRKNFLPTLFLIILFWSFWGLLIFFIDPSTYGVIPLFFIISFVALLLTSSILFTNTRRGVITASLLTLFILLRYLGIGNIVNFLLILGFGITLELYLGAKSP